MPPASTLHAPPPTHPTHGRLTQHAPQFLTPHPPITPLTVLTLLAQAIVELDAAAYPIIKALPADSFPAFSAKIGDLFLGFKPDKLAKSINLGADLFNSVPQDDM